MTKPYVLLVGAVAALARLLLAILQVHAGVQSVPGPISPTMLTDYYSLYIPQLREMAAGVIPYSGFGYWYTPLFLYSMLPFYHAGIEWAALPIVASDLLTAPLVFLLVRTRSKESVALGAGIVYALMPLALVNEGYLWMSSQPMTFFLVLAVYFLETRRQGLAMVTLGVAVMFKQEAIALALPFLIWELRKGWRQAAVRTAQFGLVILAISAPFIVRSGMDYFTAVSYGLLRGGHVGLTPWETPGGAISSPIPTMCTQTDWPGLFTGAVCGPYVNPNQVYWGLTLMKINNFAAFLSPWLLLLTFPMLFQIRGNRTSLVIGSTISMAVLLLLFTATVHPAFAYYFLPIYALLLGGSSGWRMLSVSTAGSLVSSIGLEGAFQLLVVIITIMVFIVLVDIQAGTTSSAAGPTRPGPRTRKIGTG